MTPITEQIAVEVVESFSILKFFPNTDKAHIEVADLVMKLCASAEQALWLRERVSSEWNEWKGPAELRGLFCRRFKPADGILAEEERSGLTEEPLALRAPGPPLQFELVPGTDVNGNAIEGVRLLPAPTRKCLALPPAKPAETALIRQETGSHLGRIMARLIPKPASDEILGTPDPKCPSCRGTGFKVILGFDRNGNPADGIYCNCVFRLLPEHAAKIRDIEQKLTDQVIDRKELAEMHRLEAELKESMTPRRTKQQHKAEVAYLEAALNYHDPKHGGGRHRETVVGAERFLVQ
jgi:hypothetical protein